MSVDLERGQRKERDSPHKVAYRDQELKSYAYSRPITE